MMNGQNGTGKDVERKNAQSALDDRFENAIAFLGGPFKGIFGGAAESASGPALKSVQPQEVTNARPGNSPEANPGSPQPTNPPENGGLLGNIKTAMKAWRPVIIAGISIILFISLLIYFVGSLVATVVFIAIFCLVYFVLAPRNIFFVFVDEGDSVAVEIGKAFAYHLMACKGFTFKKNLHGVQEREEDNWEVMRGREVHLFGGLRFYGIWPLYKISIHCNEWAHYHAKDKALVRHEEEQGFTRLKQDSYGTEFTMDDPAEDIDGVAVEAVLIFAAWIYNPFIVRYRLQNWFNLLEPVLARVLKEFIARYRWRDDLTTMVAGKGVVEKHKEKGIKSQVKEGGSLKDELWEALKAAVTQSLDEKHIDYVVGPSEHFGEEIRFYGVAVQKLGTNIVDVDPGEKYRAMGTRRYDAETEKEARIVRAKADLVVAGIKALAQAVRGMGTFIAMTEMSGASPEEVKKAAIPFAVAQVSRQLAQEDGSYLQVNIEGQGAVNAGPLVGATIADVEAVERLAERRRAAQPPPAKPKDSFRRDDSRRKEAGTKKERPAAKEVFREPAGRYIKTAVGMTRVSGGRRNDENDDEDGEEE